MLKLTDIHKSYMIGDNVVHALRGVSLEIEAGDFVAIMGPSGSGKSTIMHLLGLLDTPSAGSYQIEGLEVAHLSDDEQAILRRKKIGFIFQQFNLLTRMTAAQNVSLPLIYSEGRPDIPRATATLGQVGLAPRAEHKPNELSGGQQQRVAIARALINQPRIILADEPTGNLDSASEQDILRILRDLNSQGITIVIVTHEEEIGAKAKRRIRMRDGLVYADERLEPKPEPPPVAEVAAQGAAPNLKARLATWSAAAFEHVFQGLQMLASNKVRTGLSMLGIMIGVAAVIAMLAIGTGAKVAIEKQLSSLGSNLLVLRPGAIRQGGVAAAAGATSRLTIEDAVLIQERVADVRRTSSTVNSSAQIAYGDKNSNSQVQGVDPTYAAMHAAEPQLGRFFTNDERQRKAQVAVIGTTLVRNLFEGANPIGAVIKVAKINFQVIGVLPDKGGNGFRDENDVVLIPITTAMKRVLGKLYVDSIDIETTGIAATERVDAATKELMIKRHRVPVANREDAFQIFNLADIQAAMTASSHTMSVLLASIAGISLLVGGIGIMNVMLISVTERTKEIGLRKAVGGRRRDIMAQFLIESLVVSLIGGLIGIVIGWGVTLVVSAVVGWSTVVSASSIGLAFAFSALIGVVFGLYPARRASRLSAIEALRSD